MTSSPSCVSTRALVVIGFPAYHGWSPWKFTCPPDHTLVLDRGYIRQTEQLDQRRIDFAQAPSVVGSEDDIVFPACGLSLSASGTRPTFQSV